MINIFTPSFADTDNINAQNTTVKQIVRRLNPDLFNVTMYYEKDVVSYLKNKRNVNFIKYGKHGNTIKYIFHSIKNDYDIYFYPRYTNLEKIFFFFNSFKKNTKLVSHIVHSIHPDLDKLSAINEKIMSRVVTDSDYCAGNSIYVSESVFKKFNIEIETIHNGIDFENFFTADSNIEGEIDVLYAGSFQKRKRPNLVIDIANDLPNFKFCLAGDGPLKNELEQKVKKNRIKNVHFTGNLSQNELGDLMRKSKLFFFPSVFEGHPQVLGQAIGCGLPAIAMECIHPDYIKNGKNGYLVSHDDQIVGYINKILSDDTLRMKMKLSSLKISKLFNWDLIASKWENAILKVLN